MCCQELIKKLNGDAECFSNKTAVEEKGRKFRLILPKKESVCCARIDDCVIKTKEKKCDFLFFRCKTQDYFFVELKGQDIRRAFEQLKDTINALKPQLDFEKKQCYAFIAASKVAIPNFSTQKQKMEMEFRKNYGKELRISSSNPDWVVQENL